MKSHHIILPLGVAIILAGVSLAPAALQETSPATERTPEETADKSEDPVCHMIVRRDPDLSAEYQGRTYYFCMKRDLEAFRKDPEKYLDGGGHDHPDPGIGIGAGVELPGR